MVLLSRNPETGRISFRHYSIVAKPSGVSKGVKSIVGRRIPDLGRLHDASELLTQGGYGSVSPTALFLLARPFSVSYVRGPATPHGM